MPFPLLAVLAGAGVATQLLGQQSQIDAAKAAGRANAREAEENARLAKERAIEDERQFRLSFQRDQGANIAAIGASGIRQEGSPLEVLRDNAANAEHDALNIRKRGDEERAAYLRQAQAFRKGASAAATAGKWQMASTLLGGAVSTYGVGKDMGYWGK